MYTCIRHNRNVCCCCCFKIWSYWVSLAVLEDQAGFGDSPGTHRDSLSFASRVLRLKLCAITPTIKYKVSGRAQQTHEKHVFSITMVLILQDILEGHGIFSSFGNNLRMYFTITVCRCISRGS